MKVYQVRIHHLIDKCNQAEISDAVHAPHEVFVSLDLAKTFVEQNGKGFAEFFLQDSCEVIWVESRIDGHSQAHLKRPDEMTVDSARWFASIYETEVRGLVPTETTHLLEPTQRSGSNHWDLYASIDGWQALSRHLDNVLTISLLELASSNLSSEKAAAQAFLSVVVIMDLPENAAFGASDSEPRARLAREINRELKRLQMRVRVDRWGDVTGE